MKSQTTGLSARNSPLFCLLLITACFVRVAAAADPAGLPQANWNRTAALQAASIPQHQHELQNWLQMIDAGNADSLLIKLQRSRQTGYPAFEAQLFELALNLAEEAPQDAAIDALLLWLADFPSAVLVAHEDHADYGVPLYPVAAAAKGSLTERQRRKAQKLANQLLNGSPERWIQHYLSATLVEQQGFNHSLRAASAEAALPLAVTLQLQLTQHPELAGPVGELASLLADPQLFLAAYQSSQGATSVSLLREANWRLDAAQRSQLLAGTIALESADKSALAISLLAPGLHRNPGVSEKLLQLLDDPKLGAAAALALAGHPDQQVQARLQELLQAGGLKGRRAALALDPSVFGQPGDNHGSDQQ